MQETGSLAHKMTIVQKISLWPHTILFSSAFGIKEMSWERFSLTIATQFI